MFGAGTGLIFILRWFWWRINAWSEITAMFVSGILSTLINFTDFGELFFSDKGFFPKYFEFPFVVLFTTVVWVIVTFSTKPDTFETLFKFLEKTNPGGPGWKRVREEANKARYQNFNDNKKNEWSVPLGIICMLIGSISIYSTLFSTGYFIYGQIIKGFIFLFIALLFGYLLMINWKKLNKLN